MIFCGDQDKTTITADAREFAINNNAMVVEFKGDHLHGMSVMTKKEPGDVYAKKIVDFLSKSKL